MKETITVRIIEGGKAREVNPLGKKPNITKIPICNNLGASFKAEQDYLFNLKKWQEAESKLRTFDFVNDFRDYGSSYDIKIEGDWIGFHSEKINIHQAKLLENGKIEII